MNDALSRTSNANLLKTFAVLTHRLHAADRTGDKAHALSIRLQRDHVEREILRRMK